MCVLLNGLGIALKAFNCRCVLVARFCSGFIISNGFTSVEFYQKINDSSDCSAFQSSSAIVGDILLATFDFDIFMTMMKDSKVALLSSNTK
jgi:hypothetical protein